jgi:hypothetical protein
MKIKQTIFALAVFIGVCCCCVGPLVIARAAEKCGSNTLKEGQNCCGGVVTSVVACGQSGGNEIENTGAWGILILIIKILTAGVGVAAVGGLAYGSILYTTAGGSPDRTRQAKMIISSTVVGIILYALVFALLNYLIPGGVFTT